MAGFEAIGVGVELGVSNEVQAALIAGLEATAAHVIGGVADGVSGEAGFDVKAAFDIGTAFGVVAAFGVGASFVGEVLGDVSMLLMLDKESVDEAGFFV